MRAVTHDSRQTTDGARLATNDSRLTTDDQIRCATVLLALALSAFSCTPSAAVEGGSCEKPSDCVEGLSCVEKVCRRTARAGNDGGETGTDGADAVGDAPGESGDGGNGDQKRDGGADSGAGCCRSRNDCAPTRWCDLTACTCRSMRTCYSDYECAASFVCNPFSHTCECMRNDDCRDWPDGKTWCSNETFRCEVPGDPPCDLDCEPGCQECVDGACRFKPGMDCCTWNDCTTPPRRTCDKDRHKCVQCLDDTFCRRSEFCDPSSSLCESRCNPPCDSETSFCDPGPPPECKAKTPLLCSPCTDNPDCETPGGDLVCPVFLPKCTLKCGDESDCQGLRCHQPSGMCDCGE